MRTSALAAVVCFVAVVCVSAAELPLLNVESLGEPVVTARMFSSGLAPNARGGWTFVGGFLNYKATGNKEKETVQLPTGQHFLAYKDVAIRPEAEWIVADLDAGSYKVQRWPGFHSAIKPALAANGRLFFSVDYGHIYYYDPVEDSFQPLGRIHDNMNELRGFYKLEVGPDGMIYGAAQSTSGLTSLLRLNPDTLEYKYYQKVGLPGRRSGLTYGYYLAVDPPWMYVAVGQGNWELFAVNADTGEKKCLGDVQGDGCRVTVTQGADFCAGNVSSKAASKSYWLIDGEAIPVVAGQKPKATPISAKKYVTPEWKKSKPMNIGKPPEIDRERPVEVGGRGEGDIFWRPNGATGDFKTLHFAIKNTEGIGIESLTVLPDGSVLGNTQSYNGFFRYFPATGKTDYYGKHGPSGVKTASYDGKLWFCGYPNVNLSAYDPTKPWTSLGKTPVPAAPGAPALNPAFIGHFGQGTTEAHHCVALLSPGNGRIYICGQRERWSTGTGLGYYEVAGGKKFGLGTANKELDPVACLALPKMGRIILSGKAKTDVKLVVYDLDLNEIERIELAPGLKNTGTLYNTDGDSRFIGCYGDPANEDAAKQDPAKPDDVKKKYVLYLYDLATKAIVAKTVIEDAVGAVSFRPVDNTYWIITGQTLNRLDPKALALTPVATLTRGMSLPVWSGKTLFGKAGGEILNVAVK
jgi:hypothetical protein